MVFLRERSCSFCYLKAIADAPYGVNEAGLGAIFAQFAAQSVDVAIDGMVVAVMPIAPHVGQQFTAGENATGVLNEVP